MFCTASLGPNTFGLLQNSVTRTVQKKATRGGLHFVGPISSFIQFPAQAVTVEFSSARTADAPGILTRTGQDVRSGEGSATPAPTTGIQGSGQPVTVSCAFQYKFREKELYDAYRKFGSLAQAQAWYEMQAKFEINQACNDLVPQDFWVNREHVQKTLYQAVQEKIEAEGYADVVMFEFMKAEFTPIFEASVVQVEVAKQNITVRKYIRNVTQVEQDINVMHSNFTAQILAIQAEGSAQKREIEAHARKRAFTIKQEAKAEQYSALQKKLNFSSDHMTTYFKIKALQLQAQNTKMVVGMDKVENTAEL